MCMTAVSALSAVAPMLDDTASEVAGFDIIKFLQGAAGYMKNIGHYLMVLAGVILVIIAVVQIAKGLAGGGRGQVNWVMSIACLLVGGMLIFGGWNLATSLAKVGKDTMLSVANGEYSEVDANGGSDFGGGFAAS